MTSWIPVAARLFKPLNPYSAVRTSYRQCEYFRSAKCLAGN
jgi:hypothetical protein